MSEVTNKSDDYCIWSKCRFIVNESYEGEAEDRCSTKQIGETCYSLYGHITEKDFPEEDVEGAMVTIRKFRDYEEYVKRFKGMFR